MGFIFALQGIKFKPVIELRARYERRVDKDLSVTRLDNQADIFSRIRVGQSFKSKDVSGQIVYQYAHDVEWTPQENLSFERSDIVLAYAQTKVGDGKLTVGRQRIKSGSDRLLGTLDWNNISYSWDGIRYTRKNFDIFSAKVGLSPRPNNDLRLTGTSYSDGVNTTLLIFKNDTRASTQVDEFTLSQLYKKGYGNLKVDVEAAVQAGHRNNKKKLAGAYDAVVTYAATKKISFSGHVAAASGGGNSDTTRTFDQLYPAAHDRHGLIDMVGWQNMRGIGAWVKYDFNKTDCARLQYHRFTLDSASDAWYSTAGKPNKANSGTFLDATGSSGRDLGGEIDFSFSKKLNDQQNFIGGIGIFQPGNFIRNFNGAATRNQVAGYIQWSLNF